MLVARRKREIDHTGGDGFVGEAVDQDERAGVAVLRVRVERQRPRNRHVADADFVERQRLGGKLRQRVDVEPVFEVGNGRRHGRVIDLHQIGAAGQQLVVGHPDQMSGELVGDLRTVAHGCQHVAAGDIDFIGKRDGYRISGLGALEFAAGADDRPDLRTRARTAAPRSRRRGLALPLAIVPEKPRKSRFGRLTHCTGMRNGAAARSSPTSTVSRCSSRCGPSYHGVRAAARARRCRRSGRRSGWP